MKTYLFYLSTAGNHRAHLLIHAENYDDACRKMREWADIQYRKKNLFYTNFTKGTGEIQNLTVLE